MPALNLSTLDGRSVAMCNLLLAPRLEAGATLGDRALPTTLFRDARGRLVNARIGELSQATLAQRLAELRADLLPAAASSPSR